MAHARIDDLYDDKIKIKRAWRAHPPNPIGLHAMAITYCVRHETGGYIPDDWLAEMLPNDRERRAILATLVEECLFTVAPHEDGTFRVYSFHLYRPEYRKPIPPRLRRAVLERDGLVCQICGGSVEAGDVDIDHRYPYSHGGSTSLENLRVTHSSCNRRKGARRG